MLKLEAVADQRLTITGVDERTYDVVKVDEDGTLGQQVMVFATAADQAAGVKGVEANGFFDDVRPAGNAIVIRRGGLNESTQLVEECALKG